jgi:hypothetical protein
MTTYKGINGFAVQSVATDPSPLDEGQVWYNNATYAFKLAGFNVAAWASGGNLSNSRGWLAGSIGTQTAGIVAGGLNPSDTKITNTEEYDGTSWTSGGSIGPPGGIYVNTLVGTQTAGLSISGESTGAPGNALTQKYDGSSWTNTGSLNTARQVGGAAGTQTATIYFGGNRFPNPDSSAMENFNGTSWTTNPASLGTGRYNMLGIGTDGAALSAGGNRDSPSPSPFGVNIVESWNGTSWTSGTNMPAGKERLGGGGTQTAAIVFGGRNAGTDVATTFTWNGTSWSSQPSMPATKANLGSGGNTSSAYAAGGSLNAPYSNTTFEWTGAEVATKTITTS